MKFKVGQEVMIVSGVMNGRSGVIVSLDHESQKEHLNWYQVKIYNNFDTIGYLGCELEVIH